MFHAPHNIQNRNCYKAGADIRRGWPIKLDRVRLGYVLECDDVDDIPIGVADCARKAGEVVEIAWLGVIDVVVSALAGDHIRLGANGVPTVNGAGRFIGIAGGDSVGAFTVVRLGLLGYSDGDLAGALDSLRQDYDALELRVAALEGQ